MSEPPGDTASFSPWWIVLVAVVVALVGEVLAPIVTESAFSLVPMVGGLAIVVFAWTIFGPSGDSVGRRVFACALWSFIGLIGVVGGMKGVQSVYAIRLGAPAATESMLARDSWWRAVRPTVFLIQSALIVGVGYLRGKRFFAARRVGDDLSLATRERFVATPIPCRSCMFGVASFLAFPASILFTLIVGVIVVVNSNPGRSDEGPQWIGVSALLFLAGGFLLALASDAKDERLWGFRFLGLLLNGLTLIWLTCGEALEGAWSGPG